MYTASFLTSIEFTSANNLAADILPGDILLAYVLNMDTEEVAVVELDVTEAGTYPTFPS